MTVGEMIEKIPSDKKREKIYELIKEKGIARYIYTWPDMLLTMLRTWRTIPVTTRVVYRQHPGSWGKWYHESYQLLNPSTKKWIYLSERRNTGHVSKKDENAVIIEYK